MEEKGSEVLATEEAKGGVSYELRLADPAPDAAPPQPPSAIKNSLSAEDIETKLKAAEERRMSFEAQKLEIVNKKFTRLQEVNQKKQESENSFMQTARQSFESKMQANKENRENYIKSIQEKLREHGEKVTEVRKSIDNQNQEMLTNIQKKLNSAAESREAQVTALIERLKEHDKHINSVKQKQLEEQTDLLKEKLQKKLEIAQEKRESMLKSLQEKLQEHKKRVLQVREVNVLNVLKDQENIKDVLTKKLEEAESKRLNQLQALQGRLQEHDKHAAEVRQNKQTTPPNEEVCNGKD